MPSEGSNVMPSYASTCSHMQLHHGAAFYLAGPAHRGWVGGCSAKFHRHVLVFSFAGNKQCKRRVQCTRQVHRDGKGLLRVKWVVCSDAPAQACDKRMTGLGQRSAHLLS